MGQTRVVYINGRFLTQQVTGVQRNAMSLLIALDKELSTRQIPDVRFVLLVPASASTTLKLINIEQKPVGRLSGHFWEQIELPWFAGKNLLVNLCNIGPGLKTNQIVIICDAAIFRFPGGYKTIFVIWYKLFAHLNSRFSKKIITISEFSRRELIYFLKIAEKKISVIYPAVKFFSDVRDDKVLDKLNLRKHHYFLAVGSLDSKKNFKGIIDAFIELDAPNIELVIVGSENSKVFNGQKIPKQENIKWTGYVQDAQLISLYESAAAFVYPSFYEGFGIPPLEAMSLGCPTIVSNVASLPEVCEEAALYCDPAKTESIKEAMLKILTNTQLRATLKVRGLERVNNFSYEESAKKILTHLLA